MKILLINPNSFDLSGRDLYSAYLSGPLFTLNPIANMSLGLPLALPTLAAHTPAHHSVRIIDEEIEPIDFDESVDLVGITAMTYKTTRAYQIAREFRNRGVQTVMGGIHASMCPDEVKPHVDSVVIGEAEHLWSVLLDDADHGRLKPEYRMEAFPELTTSRSPRYDLVNNRQYLYAYFQTTRGCPYDCNFCTVTKQNGRKLRRKTPEQVVDEVDAFLKLHPKPMLPVFDQVTSQKRRFAGTIAFIDDNFAIDRKHALAVCRALKEYQDRCGIVLLWYTQVNLAVGFDEELLTALSDSYCRHLFIGFESLDPDVLRDMKKKMNDPGRYAEAIQNIHRHGMQTIYSTIIGEQDASAEASQALENFIQTNGVLHFLPNILTPYPGSDLRKHLKDRILVHDPKYYNIRNVVFRPEVIAPYALQDAFTHISSRIFDYRRSWLRAKMLLQRGDRLQLPVIFRFFAALGLIFTAVILFAKRRLRWPVLFWIASQAPWTFIRNGSIATLEAFAVCADYDDFAYREAKRFATPFLTDSGSLYKTDSTDLAIRDILRRRIEPFLFSNASGSRMKLCRALFVPPGFLESAAISLKDEDRLRPVLVLAGTSIPFQQTVDFLAFLLKSGLSVAAIENRIGGPLHAVNPKVERVDALRDVLEHLRTAEHVKSLDIVAQSYAAFEVIRLLEAEPDRYKGFVRSITLINPSGLDPNIHFFLHIYRYFASHVLKTFTPWVANKTIVAATAREYREYLRQERLCVMRWLVRTVQNPIKSLREVFDIIAFQIGDALQNLQTRHGYTVSLFINHHDDLLPPPVLMSETERLIPKQRIRIAAGRHNDLFDHPERREAFLDFLRMMRSIS